MIVGNELQTHTDAWFYCHGSSDLMRALLPCNSNPAYHIKCCKIKCNVSERLNWPFQKLVHREVHEKVEWIQKVVPMTSILVKLESNYITVLTVFHIWKAIATANLPWHIKYSSDSQSVGCSRALEVLQMACQI